MSFCLLAGLFTGGVSSLYGLKSLVFLVALSKFGCVADRVRPLGFLRDRRGGLDHELLNQLYGSTW